LTAASAVLPTRGENPRINEGLMRRSVIVTALIARTAYDALVGQTRMTPSAL